MRNSSGRAFKDCKFRDKGREATITTYIVRREGEKIFHTIYKNHKSNLSENEKKKEIIIIQKQRKKKKYIYKKRTLPIILRSNGKDLHKTDVDYV